MNLLENFSNLFSWLSSVWNSFITGINSAVDGLATAYSELDALDTRILAAVDSGFASEFGTLPVADAIGNFRYLAGDQVFYIMYLFILFGCLFTIYKLVVLIYQVVQGLVRTASTKYGGTVASLTNGWFR